MTMTFFLHDGPDAFQITDQFNAVPGNGGGTKRPADAAAHFLLHKLRIPETDGLIGRPRLADLLDKSRTSFPATVISGRAGTGKTSLAASFASGFKNVAWMTVEPPDADWRTFLNYFAAAVTGTAEMFASPKTGELTQTDIADYLISVFAIAEKTPPLVVLDGIHHIFDAPWFEDFFKLLLVSLPEKSHVLMTCRCKPPGPLWRMRSKQQLNVIDEPVLAFTVEETEELFQLRGLPKSAALEAHRNAFGRIGKLMLSM